MKSKFNFSFIYFDFGMKCDPDLDMNEQLDTWTPAEVVCCVRLSVCVYVAGVRPGGLSRAVQSEEVFIKWSTSQPGLSEAHGSREEELALSRPRAAALRHLHATRPPAAPAPPATRHEHAALLAVHVTQRHHHRGLTFILLLLLHVMNTAAHRWETEIKHSQYFPEYKSHMF